MDQDKLAGKWKQLEGPVKEQWGALTDDDLRESEGHLEHLAGKIQERTAESRDAIRSRLREFEAKL